MTIILRYKYVTLIHYSQKVLKPLWCVRDRRREGDKDRLLELPITASSLDQPIITLLNRRPCGPLPMRELLVTASWV